MQRMTRILTRTAASLFLLALVASPSWGQGKRGTATLEKEMLAAAERAGVRIQTEEMLTISRPGVTYVSTTIDGFENVPATALPESVDYGFMYIDAPLSGIPTGYYTMRVRSEEPQLGEIAGQVELIDEQGKAVAELPAQLQIHSLEVPDEPLAPRTVVGGGLDMDTDFERIIIRDWHMCPNGSWICVEIIIWDWYWAW